MANDPRLAENAGRVEHERLIDDAITNWTRQHPFSFVLSQLEKAEVPAGPIYSIADILCDPHYLARDMFEDVRIEGGETVKLPTLAPKLSDTPGGTDWPGPPLGAHNTDIFRDQLGLRDDEIEALRKDGVI